MQTFKNIYFLINSIFLDKKANKKLRKDLTENKNMVKLSQERC